jgi:hypothetical protein
LELAQGYSNQFSFRLFISEALDDMLFAGGKLNVKLLGGALETADG